MLRAFALLTLLILSWAAPISAQTATGSVEFNVTSEHDHSPVSNATVFIFLESGGLPIGRGFTDGLGYLIMSGFPENTLLSWEVVLPDGQPIDELGFFYIEPGQTKTIDIPLP